MSVSVLSIFLSSARVIGVTLVVIEYQNFSSIGLRQVVQNSAARFHLNKQTNVQVASKIKAYENIKRFDYLVSLRYYDSIAVTVS